MSVAASLSEAQLQASVASFLDFALPHDAVCHHSSNEGKRGWRAQRALKASGAKKGWPDVEIVWRGFVHFIELKSEKGRLTPEQKRMGARLEQAGAAYAVCRSLDEVEHIVARQWKIPLRAKVA